MKSGAILMVLISVLASSCANVSQLPAGGGPASVGPPQIRLGDRWTFAESNGYNGERVDAVQREVVGADGRSVRVKVTTDAGSNIDVYTGDWNWLTNPLRVVTGNLRLDYMPAFPAYVFPLEADRTWWTTLNSTDTATGRSIPMKVRAKVLGWQRVRVPAGEFDALKIRREIWLSDGDLFRTDTEILEYDWYAPKVNYIVRHEENSRYYSKTSTGGFLAPYIIKGDWRVYELTAYSPQGARD